MAAPLTPPPTEPQTTSAPVPSVYVSALGRLLGLVQNHELDAFVSAAEDIDLTGPDADAARLLVSTPLVLAYLARDDVPPARFALARLPRTLTAHPLSTHSLSLTASTAERNYPNVYARVQVLREFVATPAGFGDGDQDFTQLVNILLDIFLDRFRQRAFALVSRSYASIPLPLAQSYLGFPEDKLVAETTQAGWTFNGGVFTPQSTTPATNASQTFAPRPSSVQTFEQVVKAVAQLDTFA